MQVEVIKIRHGKVTRADAEYSEPEAAAGDTYVTLTIRVTNGSKAKLDVYSSATLTYGPDGEEAKQPYLASQSGTDDSLEGKILPGRSKVTTETFAIPSRYQKNPPPVLEFTFDFEHESSIFSGPLR